MYLMYEYYFHTLKQMLKALTVVKESLFSLLLMFLHGSSLLQGTLPVYNIYTIFQTVFIFLF
jgi:hypothetical protein